MSLRNELRSPVFSPIFSPKSEPTTWRSWYENVRKGADAVHAANADLLVFLPGQRGGRDLGVVVKGEVLYPGRQRFNFDDFEGYADKLVLEIHSYDNIDLPDILGGTPPGKYDCDKLRDALEHSGFATLTAEVRNHFPLVVSEFGWDQYVDYNTTYVECFVSYLARKPVGWMIWQIGGSYYVRKGSQDYNDSWGLLQHDWSDWRSPANVESYLRPLVTATLSLNREIPEAITSIPAVGISSQPSLTQMGGSMVFLTVTSLVVLLIIFIFPRRILLIVQDITKATARNMRRR
jgi:hypothetical protein